VPIGNDYTIASCRSDTGLFVHVMPFLIWSMIRAGIIDTQAIIWRIVPAPDDG
jgi:hypothetical protein